MGQTLVRDQFSVIFGERRGRLHEDEDEQEIPVAEPEAPTKAPFSSRREVANRRMHLAQHLLVETGWISVATVNKELGATYVKEDPALRADLNSLVEQGVCLKAGGPKPTQGNTLRYSILPFTAWPQAQQDALLAWRDSGKP